MVVYIVVCIFNYLSVCVLYMCVCVCKQMQDITQYTEILKQRFLAEHSGRWSKS